MVDSRAARDVLINTYKYSRKRNTRRYLNMKVWQHNHALSLSTSSKTWSSTWPVVDVAYRSRPTEFCSRIRHQRLNHSQSSPFLKFRSSLAIFAIVGARSSGNITAALWGTTRMIFEAFCSHSSLEVWCSGISITTRTMYIPERVRLPLCGLGFPGDDNAAHSVCWRNLTGFKRYFSFSSQPSGQ